MPHMPDMPDMLCICATRQSVKIQDNMLIQDNISTHDASHASHASHALQSVKIKDKISTDDCTPAQ